MNKTIKFGMMVALGAVALCAPKSAEAKFTHTSPVLQAVSSKGKTNSFHSQVLNDYNEINSYATSTFNSILASAPVTRAKTTSVTKKYIAHADAAMSNVQTTFTKLTTSVSTSAKKTINIRTNQQLLSSGASSIAPSFGCGFVGYYSSSMVSYLY